MRAIAKWWEPLYKKLHKSNLVEPPASPSLFFQVECGIWLAQQVGVEPRFLWAVLAMYEHLDPGWSQDQRRAISIARYYLSDDRHAWRLGFEYYRQQEKKICLYELSEDSRVSKQIHPPFAFTAGREEFYEQLLFTAPRFLTYSQDVAKPGRYQYRVRANGHGTIIRDVTIPQEWGLLTGEKWKIPTTEQLNLDGVSSRKDFTITFENLREVAEFLDEIERRSYIQGPILKTENWVGRLENIDLQIFNPEDQLESVHGFSLNGAVHLPGKLSAGKSTLMILSAIWGVLNNKHSTIVLGNVGEVLLLVNTLNERLLHPLVQSGKIPPPAGSPPFWIENGKPVAVPIVGKTSRDRHLKQLYHDTAEEAGFLHNSHLPHWGWRVLDTNCALEAYSSDAGEFRGPIPVGQEPCMHLIDLESGQPYICPLMQGCPVHQGSRDLLTSSVWVTTPAALTRMRASRLITPRIMSIYELVYRHSELVIIDECDQVQATLDDLFMPSVILAGPGQGRFLNELSRRLSQALMEQRSTSDVRGQRWVTAERMADAVTDHIYHTLTNPPNQEIRNWIGLRVFWNMNLFAFIVWQLMGTEAEDVTPELRKVHANCLDQLAPFIMRPFQHEQVMHPLVERLAQIANMVTVEAHNRRIERSCRAWISEAREWVSEIAKKLQVTLPSGSPLEESMEYWSSLAGKLEFVILTTVLDSRISIVEMEWDAAPDHLQLDQFDEYDTLQWRNAGLAQVLPSPPTGKLYGFQYIPGDPWRKDMDGILRRMRFPAMGRWALLHVHDLFFDLDGIVGPHTLLLSGTSWSPLSPVYHIDIRPAGVLTPKVDKVAQMAVGEWYFTPVEESAGKTVSISGKTGDRRAQAISTAAQSLAKRGLLDQILDELALRSKSKFEEWGDRERVLILTGSYDEAALVGDVILAARSDLANQVYVQERQADEHPPRFVSPLRKAERVARGDVQQFATLYPKGTILVAPTSSIGRGLNILNRRQKAAFGSIIFIVRSLLPPHDPVMQGRGLMHWLQNVEKKQPNFDTYGVAAEALRRRANLKWRELVTDNRPWKDMDTETRRALAATMFTQVWQAIGRGIRGGVPVMVFFIDEKWAPMTARNGNPDTEETSLLLAMKECYRSYIEPGKMIPGRDQILARALYEEPITALINIVGLKSPALELGAELKTR